MSRFIWLSLIVSVLSACGSEPTSRARSPSKTPLSIPDADIALQTPEKLSLSRTVQAELLTYARAVCNGETPLTASESLRSLHRDIIPILYSPDGKRIASERLKGSTSTIERIDTHLPALCDGAPPQSRLHLLVVGYTARFPNLGLKGFFDQKVFEPMVHGIAYEYNGRRVELDPMMQVERNFNSKAVRHQLALTVGLKPEKAPAANGLTIEVYEVLHIGEQKTDAAFSRYFRGHQPLTTEEVSHALIEQRLRWIAGWYENNIIDGEVTYEYSTAKGTYQNEERTMVRSTMAVWILNRLAEYLASDALKEAGAVTIQHYLNRYFQIDASRAAGAIQPSPIPLANGNLVAYRFTTASFIASAILEREDWAQSSQDITLLMEFAMGYKRRDHVIWTENGNSQFFMPGQLLLAVAYAYERTEDPKYKQFFDEVFGTYAQVLHQLMTLAPETVAPYAPAWFTQPATKMYQLTGDVKYLPLIFQINDRVVLNYARNAAHQVHEDYEGMLAPKLGSYGNNSITAAALEALVDAAIAAQLSGDVERYERYRRACRHAVAFLLRLQFTPNNAYYMTHSERIVGGFKKDMVNTTSWMDNVWHLTSAFIKIQNARLFEDLEAP